MQKAKVEKSVIIMRGISGSGKSTAARKMKKIFEEAGHNVKICSADNFFQRDGEYNFDPSFLSYAHDMCQAKVAREIMFDTDIILVDNTNTQKWEYKDYVQLAKKNKYDVVVHNVMNKQLGSYDTEEDFVDECHKRNKHGVPKHVIQKQLNRFEEETVIEHLL